jgi:guanylate kinase
MKKNKIFIISGPSGSGKGTIVEGVLKTNKNDFNWAKSYTTRKIRESDKTENHYIFVDNEQFKKLEKEGEIIESNLYNDSWYGSSKSEIDNALRSGKNILKDVEVNGAIKYKKLFPDSVLIFVKSNLNDIKNRLIKRGQNTEKEIEERLGIAKNEISQEDQYHYKVYNPEGHQEKAIKEINGIIGMELDK